MMLSMNFAITTLAALMVTVGALGPAEIPQPYNITMTAILSNRTYPIAALHEGAGFSLWFTYNEKIYYDFDINEGVIYEPVQDFRYIMDIPSPESETEGKATPLVFAPAGNSSVFWSLQRPTAGPCKLKGVISDTNEQVWFYAGTNYTYDAYGYSKEQYFIGASVESFWDLELDGVTELQRADVRVMVAGVEYDLC